MSETMLSVFRERVRRYDERVAIRSLAAGGAPRDETVSWREWGAAVDRTAAGLVALGCRTGDTGAVLAGNTMLWPVADLALLAAAMPSAGVYPTSAPAQVRQLLADCDATVAFVDGGEQLAKLRAVAPELPRLRLIVTADGDTRPPTPEQPVEATLAGADSATAPRIVAWRELVQRGAAALAGGEVPAELARRAAALRSETTAVLIYTSGSTGEPKGACIPHRYLLASARSIRDALGFTEADTTLSFLPFCHAAERVFGLYTRILCGMEAGLVSDHTRLWDAARQYAPTVFGGLPRFYEKVYERLQAEREAARGAERERWERVLRAGRERSRLLRAGSEVPAELQARWRTEGAPLLERTQQLFGGRMRLATSGGAALQAEIAEFLDALGVTVLGAYGLTEHLCVAFNRPDRYAFDGVGPAMPGTELRIADDGEILVRRCELTFSGYLGRPAESDAAFTGDGEWLLTGDLGRMDGTGVLSVTGRKKELIALSTGKKVAPLPIEARLQEDPWISQVMLYGEGRKFVSALICLRRGVVEAWAREHNGNGSGPIDYRALLEDAAVLARVQAAVDRVNARLSRTEQIRRFALLDRELSLEADELTPTLKPRRGVIAEKYHDRLDALYDGAADEGRVST